MSVDNNELLMLLGAKKSKQTIGIAGQQGFGVGVYGGDPADLTAIGLTPMEGCEDPSSANYGNYIHTNTSVMVYIPAFCYRIGNANAPSYANDSANALEIRDASKGIGNGWVLHRAFINGGKRKLGFFIDKYLCSADHDINIATSIADAHQLMTCNGATATTSTQSMPDCTGDTTDAITLCRARGQAYACASAFQWSALSMLSLAHGQAATSTDYCAWYSSSNSFPKGCNNGKYGDVNDNTISYGRHYDYMGKTGSGSPPQKVTHNGQLCGVADVNGVSRQILLGAYGGSTFGVAKESVSMHDFTKDNIKAPEMYDTGTGVYPYNGKWGNTNSISALFTEETGIYRAACGVFPTLNGATGQGMHLFGDDYAFCSMSSDSALVTGGKSDEGAGTGIWCRHNAPWFNDSLLSSFRAAGYAN